MLRVSAGACAAVPRTPCRGRGSRSRETRGERPCGDQGCSFMAPGLQASQRKALCLIFLYFSPAPSSQPCGESASHKHSLNKPMLPSHCRYVRPFQQALSAPPRWGGGGGGSTFKAAQTLFLHNLVRPCHSSLSRDLGISWFEELGR